MRAATALGNPTVQAAIAVLIYGMIIGFVDNHVRIIAAEISVWQFQAIRSLMALALVLAWMAWFGSAKFKTRRLPWVLARSVIMSVAILTYFGSLGFLTVAQAAAGLFTAPIFVLLIGKFVYGHVLGAVKILAVGAGFLGVLLVLSPDPDNLTLASFVPIFGGALYALANITTREWCEGESAEALTFLYLMVLGLCGALGLLVVTLWGPEGVAPGSAGFLLRGWVWPSAAVLFWTFMQALGSLLALLLLVRAYQLAEASRVAVFEYVVLPFSALWAWLLWGASTGPSALWGMLIILLSGVAMVWTPSRSQRISGQ